MMFIGSKFLLNMAKMYACIFKIGIFKKKIDV